MVNFIFWSMASHGTGISGGDRIYIEFAKRWSKKYPVRIVTWSEGMVMMNRNGLVEDGNVSFKRVPIPQVVQLNFFVCYVYRILASLVTGIMFRIDKPAETYLYSSSEFWMDSLAAWIVRVRYPACKWVATWYQTAPSPIRGFSDGMRANAYRLNALLLWFAQGLVKPIISRFADFVLVNNELERAQFPESPVIVVLGAVNTDQVNDYLKKHRDEKKKYAAVFQGRMHAQKGVVELIDIWREVVRVMPQARLAMIGDGPLMVDVKRRVALHNLERHIDLLGYLFDGNAKYKVFSQSRIAVHPAFFDSGGMATAEAIAFGIPAVGFDLPAYQTYYPVGMVKVKMGDLSAFSRAILDLLKNPRRRNELGRQARNFIIKSYSWNYRSNQVLNALLR